MDDYGSGASVGNRGVLVFKTSGTDLRKSCGFFETHKMRGFFFQVTGRRQSVHEVSIVNNEIN
jgi:hypothetical protein